MQEEQEEEEVEEEGKKNIQRHSHFVEAAEAALPAGPLPQTNSIDCCGPASLSLSVG